MDFERISSSNQCPHVKCVGKGSASRLESSPDVSISHTHVPGAGDSQTFDPVIGMRTHKTDEPAGQSSPTTVKPSIPGPILTERHFEALIHLNYVPPQAIHTCCQASANAAKHGTLHALPPCLSQSFPTEVLISDTMPADNQQNNRQQGARMNLNRIQGAPRQGNGARANGRVQKLVTDTEFALLPDEKQRSTAI